MEFLTESIRNQVRDAFKSMKDPVKILFFGRNKACDTCHDTHQLIEEVVALSEKIELEVFDMDDDPTTAKQFHVDKAPGLVITALNDRGEITDFGIRLSGIPSGHEFTTLIQDILLVSGRDSGLTETTRIYLKKLSKPVHLQVFVTPT